MGPHAAAVSEVFCCTLNSFPGWCSFPPPPPRRSSSSEPPLYARAAHDFMARSGLELSVSRGDVVQVRQAEEAGTGKQDGGLTHTASRSLSMSQVMKRSSQWCLIRNSRGEEGSVPQIVLEPMRSGSPAEDQQVSPPAGPPGRRA